MSSSKPVKNRSKEAGRKRKNRAAEIANTLEWLITAFVLAFLFRAFVMEAFRIPTGSMADTLMGAHFRLRCGQCGYKYDYDFVPEKYGLPQDTVPRRFLKPGPSRCPSCGHYQLSPTAMPIANGDRILVLKCIYQFFEPKRWDVVVFKNPLDPTINYIKRLVGLPGETVEIIDGDIYINGRIRRKPPKIQNVLWMPVYDNNYQPVRPLEGSFNGHIWKQPFKNIEDSEWMFDKANPTIFRLDSPADRINTLIYDTTIGNDFKATYAYDDVGGYEYMPYCSDLMVRFYARSGERRGFIGIELIKYQTRYRAWFDYSALDMVITKSLYGQEAVELARKHIDSPPDLRKSILVKLVNVDHQLIFEFGQEKLTYDLGRLPEDAGERKTDIKPEVKIFGSGKLTLSNVAIFRDIHYTAVKFANSPETGRATEGNPFTLGKDEFFVLGDNSPNSEDGRWWNRRGIGNNGISYDEGTVPRDYLVGKALLVYWPSGFKLFAADPWGIVPNVGRMRFIYGGSNKSP